MNCVSNESPEWKRLCKLFRSFVWNGNKTELRTILEKQKSVGKKGGVLKGQRGRLLTWTSIPLSFLPTAIFYFAYLPLCIPKGVKYQVLSSSGCLDLVTHWPVWFADANKRKSTIIVPFIGLALVWKGSEKSNKHCSLRTERKSEIINLKFSFSPPATAIATAITRDYNENCWKCKYQLFKSVLNALVWFFSRKRAQRVLSFQKQSSDWRLTQLSSFHDVCSLCDILQLLAQ